MVVMLALVSLPSVGLADEAANARQILTRYERIRSALVNDTGRGIAAQAQQIQRIAGRSENGELRRAGEAAGQLAELPATDLPALRRAFGELSRPLVALLGRMPQLTGYHIFECPMAAGYKRWIQRTTAVENPYMGSRMLTCGAPVT